MPDKIGSPELASNESKCQHLPWFVTHPRKQTVRVQPSKGWRSATRGGAPRLPWHKAVNPLLLASSAAFHERAKEATQRTMLLGRTGFPVL